MSKRRLEFLDLPAPVKRAKIRPSIEDCFSSPDSFGFVRFTAAGTQYREVPLMLPFSVAEVNQDRVNPLPLHNWNHLGLHRSSDALHRASLQAISETIQAITVEDRAVARFCGYVGYSRTIPFDHGTLPRCQQWIAPVPFTPTESLASAYKSPLYIDYQCIEGAYFPKKYHGIRQSFIIDPLAHPWETVRRGTKVVLGSVLGDAVAYFVTRIRFIRNETVGVEVVAITEDGAFHDDSSLAWPPFMLEIPARMVDTPSFGEWVPSIIE